MEQLKKRQNLSDEDLKQNDFAIEMIIYRQAQAAALEGINKLHKLNIQTKRPDNYFAQMSKSDEHMEKVRYIFYISLFYLLEKLYFIYKEFFLHTIPFFMVKMFFLSGLNDLIMKVLKWVC